MSRILALAALLLPLAAHGQPPVPVPPGPPAPPSRLEAPAAPFLLELNLGDIPGVVAGNSLAAANNSRLIQSVLDNPFPSGTVPGATTKARRVTVPDTWPQPIYLDRPIRVPEGVDLQGVSARLSTLSSVYSPWVLLENLPLDPIDPATGKRLPLSPDHWVDVGQMGDHTAAGAFGPRWGFRTRGNAFLACPGALVSTGPRDQQGFMLGFQTLDHLTITATIVLHDAAKRDGILFGVSDGSGSPLWQFRTGFGMLWFGFKTGDGVKRAVYLRGLNWGSSNQLAIDLDLAKGRLVAVINGQQVNSSSSLGDDFPAGGLKLAANPYAEFTLGVDSLANAQAATGTILDFTTVGLRVGTKAVYQDQGVGKPAARIDGRPPNDARCYDEGPDLLWLLRNEEQKDPSDLIATGLLPMRPANDYAIALQPANSDPGTIARGNRIQRLSLRGGILTGPISGLRIQDVDIDAGLDGVASLLPVATYPTLISDSLIGSKRYPLNLWMQMMLTVRDSTITHAGATAIALRDCGQIAIRDNFVAGFGTVERVCDIVGSADNQCTTIDNMGLDFEGVNSPSDCLFRITANSGQSGARVRIVNVTCGTVPADVTLIRLLSRTGTTGPVSPAAFTIENVSCAFGTPPLVDCSKQWWGRVVGAWAQDKLVTGEGAAHVTTDQLGTPGAPPHPQGSVQGQPPPSRPIPVYRGPRDGSGVSRTPAVR